MNTALTLALAVATTILASCSDGSSEGSGLEELSEIDEVLANIPSGGNLAAPTLMESGEVYSFGSNAELNYFGIDVEAGETVFLNVSPYEEISSDVNNRCTADPSRYTMVGLADGSVKTCSYDFEHTFESAGRKRFKIGLPFDNIGIFAVATADLSKSIAPLPANGQGGTPGEPRYVDVNGDNLIEDNNLLNYYAYEAVAGETISIAGSLSNVADLYQRRCVVGGTAEFGVSVDGSRPNCQANLVHTFEQAGVHRLSFRTTFRSSGSFLFSTDRYLP